MPLAARSPSSVALAPTVTAALAGDSAAWARLVRRYEPMLRDIGRQHRLAPPDIEDVTQATWLRLFRMLGAIRTPAALGGWLATTMKRECWRRLQAPSREVLVEVVPDAGVTDDVLSAVLAAERRDALREALTTLPERHRELMVLLTVEPALSYAEIGARLGIPTGSIGPIRARSLARLRRDARLRWL